MENCFSMFRAAPVKRLKNNLNIANPNGTRLSQFAYKTRCWCNPGREMLILSSSIQF